MTKMPETITGWKTKSHQFSLHGILKLAALLGALILFSGCKMPETTTGWKTKSCSTSAEMGQFENEERLDAVDPLPAVFPRVGGFPVGVLGGHAPAQVHVEKLQPQLLDAFAQLREDDGDQMVSFRVHIAEGGRDEGADGLLGDRHED